MNLDIFDGMKGNLTQAHIDKGVRDLCRECPAALCISDMLVEQKISEVIVEVGTNQVRLHTGDWQAPCLVADIDTLLEEWIEQFDKGEQVPKGKIYIKRDGFCTDVLGNQVQKWRCGIHINA